MPSERNTIDYIVKERFENSVLNYVFSISRNTLTVKCGLHCASLLLRIVYKSNAICGDLLTLLALEQ